MSVKVHEAFSMDSFQDRLLWFDDFHGDQLQDEWRDAGTGSAVVVDAQTGGIVRITTGAVEDNAHYIDWQDIRSLLVTKKVTMEFRLKLSHTVSQDIYCALYFDASNYVRFYVDTDVSNNWYIRARNGGVSTSRDTGIATDTSYHVFRIECFPTDEVHFYIDGVETALSPITTNIPDDAADYLQPYFLIATREAVSKFMDIDYCYVRQNR